ncbi:hypothetical protein [uncultured Roseobacter sp.]|uniref:hypothetical protein n=1 Tax=uncultured Roseobacter sp. TaxID=114847 RepID=UPI002605D233|nr:hypothetical protein [uncultured Roseobacter sp.]
MEKTELDWGSLSAAERKGPTKTLYGILRKLHAQQGGRFDDLFEQAQGMPLSQGVDPYSNIKRGVYDRNKMRSIHEWLATNHFAFAQSEAPSLFQHPRRDPWEVFLEENAVDGGLSIIPADGFGIASRKPPQDNVPVFRLGQKYLFELTAPQPAYVVAFEEHEGIWYPLALGETERTLIVRVGTGTTKLPCAQDGTSIPLMEHDHTGPHRFTFLLCVGPKPPAGRDGIILYAQDNKLTAMQTTMRLIP